jgi:hypothetical protein
MKMDITDKESAKDIGNKVVVDMALDASLGIHNL